MEAKYSAKRHITDLKPYVQPEVKELSQPISLRKLQTGQEPEVPLQRNLRLRSRLNYRTLAGYRVNQKSK